jgi:hypothetical protein
MVVVVGRKRFFVKMKSDRDKKRYLDSGHNTEFSGLMVVWHPFKWESTTKWTPAGILAGTSTSP